MLVARVDRCPAHLVGLFDAVVHPIGDHPGCRRDGHGPTRPREIVGGLSDEATLLEGTTSRGSSPWHIGLRDADRPPRGRRHRESQHGERKSAKSSTANPRVQTTESAVFIVSPSDRGVHRLPIRSRCSSSPHPIAAFIVSPSDHGRIESNEAAPERTRQHLISTRKPI